MYKYVYKGHDRAIIELRLQGTLKKVYHEDKLVVFNLQPTVLRCAHHALFGFDVEDKRHRGLWLAVRACCFLCANVLCYNCVL
jgi:hypothetical protein